MRNKYDLLVTMDADLSHDPKDIPRLIKSLGDGDFLIGSRYAKGGTCDYVGYRKELSRLANLATRLLMRINIHEFTTSFRVFNVKSLQKVKFNWIGNFGYSFFLEAVVRLHANGLSIKEEPIHFYNRHSGKSKIPSLEIFRGMSKLLQLFGGSFVRNRTQAPSQLIDDACMNCGQPFLYELYPELMGGGKAQPQSNLYKCSSMGHVNKPQIAQCLQCGMEQIPLSKQPKDLNLLYSEVVDSDYLENFKIKQKTFQNTFKKIKSFLPESPGILLEIGSYCGLFLQEASKAGWQCWGIEPSKWAADYSRSANPNAKIFNINFEEAPAQLPEQFDLVASWDVIEHVRDPNQMLKMAHHCLKPGGILTFSTLDMDSWFPKLMGRRWPWIMEMHLYYFRKKVLEDMLRKNQFLLLHACNYCHYASLQYIFKKIIYIFPRCFHRPLDTLIRWIPDWVIPVSLGDIKLFVAKKS
jgi:2-polyprenyl-3-methyl-5-hydroxy-6-metoxy-1,4-benzoquinol methylase